MSQPQYELSNWFLTEIREGRMKVGESFECRQNGGLPVTPEMLACGTHGSLYNLMQIMRKAGLFTSAGDGHLAIANIWEDITSAGDVIALIKQARPAVRPKAARVEKNEAQDELPLEEPPLEFNLFDVLDQLTEAERITVAMGLMQSLTTRAPELERTIAQLNFEVGKRDGEIERLHSMHQAETSKLREELKAVRANEMLLRQELESKRVSVARTIEKIVTVDSGKSTPTGGDWGHEGRGRIGAASGPRVTMHRKPAMGHVPKVVREHLTNGHKPE